MIDTISPGVVGSVGDALANIRLKESCPELPIRFEQNVKTEKLMGTMVQNGSVKNYYGSLGPTTIYKGPFIKKRSWKTQNNYQWQDLKAAEKRYEPTLAFRFNNYDNQRASVFAQSRTGAQFSRLPGGYGPRPGDVPRGSALPRITDLAIGDTLSGPSVVTGRSSKMVSEIPVL